jgi:MioC protein
VSGQRVGIFVATMTGMAELCATEIETALLAAGLDSKIALMDDLGADALAAHDIIVVVSSTYGHGDIPDNGQAFYAAVRDGAMLAGKQFCVFALGDRSYADTYCHAGNAWDALFAGKGAARLAPLERHDASSGTLAEDVAGEWATRWITNLKQAA